MKFPRIAPVVIFLAVLILSACSAGISIPAAHAEQLPTLLPTEIPPTATLSSTATPTPVVDCSPEDQPSFMDYNTWTRVNDQPISGHEKFVYVYVNDQAKETYLSASGDLFPVCSKIVKEHLVSQNSQTVSEMTVMIKMPAGFDPAHNDWWWGLYDASGKTAMMSGKVQVCIACHEPQADEDYVFSEKVLGASGK